MKYDLNELPCQQLSWLTEMNSQWDFLMMNEFGVYLHQKGIMARQSISFTEPNDEWLKTQVDSKEYSSKSELINDLIRQARNQQKQIDWIKAKLTKAEGNGFTTDTKAQILAKSKSRLNG